jgi:hypothetical protein
MDLPDSFALMRFCDTIKSINRSAVPRDIWAAEQ